VICQELREGEVWPHGKGKSVEYGGYELFGVRSVSEFMYVAFHISM
jgi:hypothetical protein